jgi:hypothetical protein
MGTIINFSLFFIRDYKFIYLWMQCPANVWISSAGIKLLPQDLSVMYVSQ